MKFEELGLNNEITNALSSEGIVEPTDIQAKAIPHIIEGKDLIGISRTGSGKTASFGAPLLQRIVPGIKRQALIMAPTRELAVQISNEMKKFGKNINLSVATVFGGVAFDPQVKDISRSEIIVGTPGRLLDHLQRNSLDLSGIRCIVLDEADKMVEMGFIEDITRIISYAPKDRQILLFGATISEEIKHIKEHYMHSPVTVKAETNVHEDFLKQYYYDVSARDKFSLLMHLIKKEDIDSAIIFCSARSTVEMIHRNLREQGIKSEMIHGKLTQNKRLKVMENFNKGRPNILVASAVAARGLDISCVSHIFNYDLSSDPQEYIHRVGRTARAGSSGKAFTLLSQRDYEAFGEINSRYNLNIIKLEPENFERLRFNARAPQRQTGRGFGRGQGFSSGRDGNSRDFRGGPRGPRREGGQRGGRDGSRGGFGRDRQGQGSFGRSGPRPERRVHTAGDTSARVKRFGKDWNSS